MHDVMLAGSLAFVHTGSSMMADNTAFGCGENIHIGVLCYEPAPLLSNERSKHILSC